MTLPYRFTVLALTGLLVLAVSVMLPRDPGELGEAEAAADPIPPLHMSVPTAPYAPAN